MDGLVYVVLNYRVDEDVVTYGRRITGEQLGELIVKLDEMADENEES